MKNNNTLFNRILVTIVVLSQCQILLADPMQTNTVGAGVAGPVSDGDGDVVVAGGGVLIQTSGGSVQGADTEAVPPPASPLGPRITCAGAITSSPDQAGNINMLTFPTHSATVDTTVATLTLDPPSAGGTMFCEAKIKKLDGTVVGNSMSMCMPFAFPRSFSIMINTGAFTPGVPEEVKYFYITDVPEDYHLDCVGTILVQR